jgi:isoquinoline 1-oxidoreductase alpha subunit
MTNICRCGSYNRVRAAIHAVVSGKLSGAGLQIQHADGSRT